MSDAQSKVHKAAVPRIEAQPDGPGLMSLFNAMIAEAEEEGREVGQVCIPFIDEEDEFTAGEWVPEFWLVIRKVLND